MIDLLTTPLLIVVLIILIIELSLHTRAYYVRRTGRATAKSWQTFNTRVLMLGDSNTYGLYLDQEESYPGQLETICNATKDNPKIEVINLGYPGTNSSRLLSNFSRLLSTFRPDIVTVMIGANDGWTVDESIDLKSLPLHKRLLAGFQRYSRIYKFLYMLSRRPYDINQLNIHSEKGETRTREHDKMVSNSPEAIREIGRTITKNDFRDDVLISYGDDGFQFGFQGGSPSDDWDDRLRRNLCAMGEIGATYGVRFYFLTYPSSNGLYGLTNQIIRRTVTENTIPLIDIGSVIEKEFSLRFTHEELFFPDFHATRRCNAFVARAIMNEFFEHYRQEAATQT